VVYGGNAALRATVSQVLGELTEVHLVENVRPAFDEEHLDHATAMLAQIYYDLKVAGLGSSGVLADWSNSAPIISAHAFGGIAEYLAAAGKGRVIGLDVGSGQVSLVSATEGAVDLLVRTDKGLGRPIRYQLAPGLNDRGPGAKREDGREGPLADYILDKSVHPNLIPQTSSAASFELALAQRLTSQIASEAGVSWSWPGDGLAPPCHTLLLRGRVFTNAADSQRALLALLDGLKPQGVFRIVADSVGILPAMGLLAAEDPDMVVQVLHGHDLAPWAWVVVPSGYPRSGDALVTVTLSTDSGQVTELVVASGAMEIVPLPQGQRCKVALEPAAGVDVGSGRGKRRELTIASAEAGLVIDGRRAREGR
jgi:hypothetical protein